MDSVIEIAVYLFIAAGTLFVAWLIGTSVEAAHLRKLAKWEAELSGIMISDMKRIPPNWLVSDATLVVGEVMIATDYYRVFVAGIRNLFGGSVPGFERLMDRARREAMVRMLWQAKQLGANVVWNVRLATSTVQASEQRKPGGVAVIAYGTAMKATSK